MRCDTPPSNLNGERAPLTARSHYVNADEKVHAVWRYLLVSESDVDTAKGSWSALVRLGGE